MRQHCRLILRHSRPSSYSLEDAQDAQFTPAVQLLQQLGPKQSIIVMIILRRLSSVALSSPGNGLALVSTAAYFVHVFNEDLLGAPGRFHCGNRAVFLFTHRHQLTRLSPNNVGRNYYRVRHCDHTGSPRWTRSTPVRSVYPHEHSCALNTILKPLYFSQEGLKKHQGIQAVL